MNANRRLGAVALIGVVLLVAGCSPAGTTSPTPTVTSATPTTPSTVTPSAPTPSPGTPEAKITATIQGYNDYLNRAFTDPSVPATDAANYLADLPPDYVFQAVQRNILQFRAQGYKQSGTAPITILSIAPADGGAYLSRVCTDSSQVTVTDAKGQPVNSGPARASAAYTLVNSVDGVWRISKIQGTGTAC